MSDMADWLAAQPVMLCVWFGWLAACDGVGRA